MVAAANRLRLPYWDWGVNAVPPPEIIELPKLEVLQPPSGRPGLVPNPFLAYTFPLEFFAQPAESFAEQPALAVWPKTLRCPTTVTADAQTNLARLRAWVSFIDNCSLQMLMRDPYQCPSSKSVRAYRKAFQHADTEDYLEGVQQP